MAVIDLNADLAEGCDDDAALLGIVSSCNIACGAHAGDPMLMQRTVRLAKAAGVAIGAHPSFPDREHAGRRELYLPCEEVKAHILFQLGGLQAICRTEGVALSHVKPHGALYNMASRDRPLAEVVVEAVLRLDPCLRIFGLSGGTLLRAAKDAGLAAASEGFADRRYRDDGSLVPRSEPGAVIAEIEECVAQALQMVEEGVVRSTSGRKIAIAVETLCVHGDTPHALELSQRLRLSLLARGHTLQAMPRPLATGLLGASTRLP